MARRRGDEAVHQLCSRLHDETLPPRQEVTAPAIQKNNNIGISNGRKHNQI